MNPYHEQFERLREAYSQRRGLVPEMLEEADRVLQAAIEYERAQCEAEVTQARSEIDRQVKLRFDAQRQTEKAIEAYSSQTSLFETRTKSGDLVKVKMDKHRDQWTVADIEEVAYRLRMGGATDDSPIKLESGYMIGLVPDATMVKLDLYNKEPATAAGDMEKLRQSLYEFATAVLNGLCNGVRALQPVLMGLGIIGLVGFIVISVIGMFS